MTAVWGRQPQLLHSVCSSSKSIKKLLASDATVSQSQFFLVEETLASDDVATRLVLLGASTALA